MKPSRLGIGAKSLARGSTFANTARPLRRTGPPRRRSRLRITGLTPEQQHRQAVEHAAVNSGAWGCQLAHVLDGDCDGPLQADHIIEKARLKLLQGNARVDQPDHPITQVEIEELIADGRNGFLVCEYHHNLKTHHLRPIPRDCLPPSVEEFATEYEIERVLDKAFGWKGPAA